MRGSLNDREIWRENQHSGGLQKRKMKNKKNHKICNSPANKRVFLQENLWEMMTPEWRTGSNQTFTW